MRDVAASAEIDRRDPGDTSFAASAPARSKPLIAALPILVLGALLVAALLGVFGGGKSVPVRADTSTATFIISTPQTLRSGLFFETRILVAAHRAIDDVVIAVPPELWRDQTINTMIPSPEKEAGEDGIFRFHYGPLAAGKTLTIKFDGQLNPPLFAGTRGTIVLQDGDRPVASLTLSYRVWP